ncbi:MAG TPA: acetyl/propionyl/methylcrotonyl-CoA carboxylase subunit alpha [Stellaceae bacterium]|nr:acetyl/propionyl/methylcrotonyl-CoA carboxylase subunit alpha [Stellaceae bacterium]
MFKKILIANRGEIACRVVRTARRMGIKSVAVYSDADRDALHVRMADEAVAIGGARSAESYLRIDAIVEACKKTGAEAVHPGYGFLSERAEFAAALEKAGVVFIGPPPAAIAAMGDKIASKKLAKKAGVTTVPGHLGVIPDAEAARKIAQEVGYPVMIKASAGGGGKGMRIARSDAEIAEGFRLAQNEARASFADERVFIEKYVEEPRHIEIQVLADAHGTVLHLGERECSIQRRHQKVIEEAPSPFLDAKTRAAMGAEAVALAAAVGYRSAGTVEFIVDARRNFYFLEMNTRLQVEHPVTECVTGLDLVEWMIRIAAGEKLPFGQKDIKHTGHAIEARVYAEDPARGFLPSIGRLVRYREPHGDGVRVDSGVYEGAEIGIHYDPMIAKTVGFGADRETASARLIEALDAFVIRGVTNNIGFLAALLERPRFAEGRLTTNFIAEEFPGGAVHLALPQGAAPTLRAVAAVVAHLTAESEASIGGQLAGHAPPLPTEWAVMLGESRALVRVEPIDDGYAVTEDGKRRVVLQDWRPGEPLFRGTVDGEPVIVQVDRDGAFQRLTYRGVTVPAKALSPRAADLLAAMPAKAKPDLSRALRSPMPGLLVSIAVKPGQGVKAGEELAVVEAMKMENVLRAERDATVGKLCANPGDSLAVDQVILEFA